MTITKNHIIEKIHENTNLRKTEISRTFQSLMEIMKQTLSSGENILISGFRKFCVKEKNGRRGRNPEAGEDMNLEARRVVTFKCSGKLREKFNTIQ
jgi:integration host factor subunit alpha